MRLALWQGQGVAADLQATLAQVTRAASLASEGGVDLLVFPEGFLTGYYLPNLVPGDLLGVHDALAEVGQIAAKTGLGIVMGSHLLESKGMRNAAVVFDASGREVGRYHKRALFGSWENATFAPGNGPLTFKCGGFTIGVAICYDIEFPELIRPYGLMKADLVVVPTALMAPHDRIARLVVPVRAMENQVFVGYCNRTGHEAGLDYVGQSSICGPRGACIAVAQETPEMIVGDLSRSELEAERQENSYVDDLGLWNLGLP